MLTLSAAQATMKTARNAADGKPLMNNTRLYKRRVPVLTATGKHKVKAGRFLYTDGYAVQLHATDVVTILPDSLFMLNTGGWDTPTTWSRIKEYCPGIQWEVHGPRGMKLVLKQPNPEDPRPQWAERVVSPYFHAINPGPEPVRGTDGCIAGTIDEYSFQRSGTIYKGMTELGSRMPAGAFVRGFDRWGDLKYTTEHNGTIEYGEESYRHGQGYTSDWGSNQGERVYKQCPHCKAFDARHRAWTTFMYGDRWKLKTGGYDQFTQEMALYDTEAGWRDAAREDFRRVKAEREEYRNWIKRNTEQFYDGIIVDSYGYAIEHQPTPYVAHAIKTSW